MSKIKNLFLNHIYAVIAEDTYDEIKKSDFLKNEFCHCEEKTHAGETPAGTKMTWTGFYMTGENTYLELFNEKDKKQLQGMKVGNVGVAFSVDKKEEIEGVITLFKQKFGNNVNHGIFEKKFENNLVPWFYYVELVNDSSMMQQLDTWVMAYHKDYLGFKNIKKTNKDSITRKEYNKECNAVLFDKNKLFRDIEEITLLLNDENKRKFVELLILLGYSCEESEDCIICRGPSIIFKLKTSEHQTSKLLKLQMSLNYNIDDPQVYELGNSTIKLENKTATWTFK